MKGCTMKEDTRKALERFEKELLAQEEFQIIPEDWEQWPEDVEIVYRNYANHYGKKEYDRTEIALVITICFLCMGIIGVLIYWMEAYF